MDDRLDAVAWYWILRHADYDTVRIVDHYDASDVYTSHCKHGDNTWDAAARMIRATHVAEACVVVFEDVDHKCVDWMQVLLDEGYPRLSNYSSGFNAPIFDQAILFSNRVAEGNLSLWTVINGTLTPEQWETNNG